ncbi:hypothetical protein [Dokdonia sp.]|uniref:hypothetical protein n=1 Tax=Dokdonia sp. TaxID=2024995 RepID=UPI0032670B75
MNDIDKFWIENSDKKIQLTIHQYFFTTYKYEIPEVHKITSNFLRYLYYATIGIEELIDNTWEQFKNTPFNTIDFFEAIDFFNSKFSSEIKKRIENAAIYDENDQITEYAIEHKELLNEDIAEALRYRRKEIEHIVPDMVKSAKKNREKMEKIKMEKWRKIDT